jgi:hypothetical protein
VKKLGTLRQTKQGVDLMLLDAGRLEEDLLLLLPCRSSYLAGSVSFELLFECGSLSVLTQLQVDSMPPSPFSLFSAAMLYTSTVAPAMNSGEIILNSSEEKKKSVNSVSHRVINIDKQCQRCSLASQ